MNDPMYKFPDEMEEIFKLEKEAMHLLDIISAEFASDPISVQCFDLRIVERSKFVSKRLKQLAKTNPLCRLNDAS